MAEKEEGNKDINEKIKDANKSEVNETDNNDDTEDGRDCEDLDSEKDDYGKHINVLPNNALYDVTEDSESEHKNYDKTLDMMHDASGFHRSRSTDAYSDDSEEFDDTEEIEEYEDSESESEDAEKKTVFMHHASCMNRAAMDHAYFICHNVQVSQCKLQKTILVLCFIFFFFFLIFFQDLLFFRGYHVEIKAQKEECSISINQDSEEAAETDDNEADETDDSDNTEDFEEIEECEDLDS